MNVKQKSIEVFCCYASKDRPLLLELQVHLVPLQREGLITFWADVNIGAGQEWLPEIERHLNTAPLILLLVSPDFMASEYCYSIEMHRAMERHERGEAQVIPIILRPTDWKTAPFGKLQALPENAMPVVSSIWHTNDEAFLNVAAGIRAAIQTRLIVEEHLRQAEEERLRQAEEERLRRAEAEAKEQQLARKKNYKYYKFCRDVLYASVFAVGNAELFLLGGMGTLVGIFTQEWLWAIGTVAIFFALVSVGYRKALPPLLRSIIAIVSGVLAYGITILVEPLHYDTVMTDNFLFMHTVTLQHQITAGMCIGAISSLAGFYVLNSSKENSFATNFYAGAILIGIGCGCVVWLIVNLLAWIFSWGFGFDTGWDLNFFGGYLVTAFAGIGLICLYYVWSKSYRASISSDLHDMREK